MDSELKKILDLAGVKYKDSSVNTTAHTQSGKQKLSEGYDVVGEEAPPGMEDWIKDRKDSFKKQYGDEWKEVLYSTAWKEYNKNDESVEEEVIGDLGNGYDDQHSTTKNYSDYFPTGAHGTAVRDVGPAGGRHGDNPMQKVMKNKKVEEAETKEIHKNLVYAYREYISESLSVGELRKSFWRDHPEYAKYHNSKKRQNDYPAVIRTAWVEYVDHAARSGMISDKLAQRATL